MLVPANLLPVMTVSQLGRGEPSSLYHGCWGGRADAYAAFFLLAAEAVRADLELDRPFIARYGSWLGGFVTGDLGNYYTVSSSRPVSGLWGSPFVKDMKTFAPA